MKKKTKLNLSIFLLVIILCSISYLGLKSQNTILERNYEKYKNLITENNSNKIAPDIENSSFYQKVQSGENVNILLLGDEITLGITSNEDVYQTDKEINTLLKSAYNTDSSFQFLEEKNATISSGYDSFDKNPEVINYDLVIISFGLNDFKANMPVDQFSQYYSDLIGKIKNRNYKCSIVAVLPPSLTSENSYVSAVKSVCKLNGVDYLDIPERFTDSSTELSELINGDFPTLSGYNFIVSEFDTLIQRKIQ